MIVEKDKKVTNDIRIQIEKLVQKKFIGNKFTNLSTTMNDLEIYLGLELQNPHKGILMNNNFDIV